MEVRPEKFKFDEATLALFSYHEGFTAKLRSVSLKVLNDGATEFQTKEFQQKNRSGKFQLPLSLLHDLAQLSRVPKTDFEKFDFPSNFEDLGFGSLQIRNSESGSLLFRLQEPLPGVDLADPAKKVVSAFKDLQEIGFSLFS